MAERLRTGLIVTPLVLLLLWQGGVWWLGLVVVVAALAGIELFTLLQRGGFPTVPWIGVIWIEALVLLGWPDLSWLPPSAVISAGMMGMLIYVLYRPEAPLLLWATTGTGALYLGIVLSQVVALRLLPDHGLWWVGVALALTWVNDTLAYGVGLTLGRHKIWPRLSPKKSWEGTVGGVLGTALLGGVLAHYSPLPLTAPAGAGLGALVGILSFFGDLSISMIKRQVGVKDSGTLFPGHGGMLDRLDSLLFVVPLVYHIALFSTAG